MRTYQEIAEHVNNDYNTTPPVEISDVQSAMISAERYDYDDKWFVNSDDGIAYGMNSDRHERAYGGSGFDTKEAAVINALQRGFRADRNNWQGSAIVR